MMEVHGACRDPNDTETAAFKTGGAHGKAQQREQRQGRIRGRRGQVGARAHIRPVHADGHADGPSEDEEAEQALRAVRSIVD
jgi:hypothetical protein